MNKKLKVLFITGSYPPKVCGVGDYTFKLINRLKQFQDFEFELFYKESWSLSLFFSYFKELKKSKVNFYHFQYPTEGYSYSLLPLVLIFFLPKKRVIVTVHEISSRNIMAYIYTQAIVALSGKVIVSNSLEKKHATRYIFNKSKVSTITVGSNIDFSVATLKGFSNRDIDMAYFGHIRPLKGIDDFIEVAQLLGSGFTIAIIGQTLDNYKSYYSEIINKANKSGIKIMENRSETEVASLLTDAKIVYLPFPDGVSNRRGSLLAGIEAGCQIVTKRSKCSQFNDFFDSSCFLIEGNKEAAELINNLLTGASPEKDTSGLISQFSWDNIVVKHLSLYKNDS